MKSVSPKFILLTLAATMIPFIGCASDATWKASEPQSKGFKKEIGWFEDYDWPKSQRRD